MSKSSDVKNLQEMTGIATSGGKRKKAAVIVKKLTNQQIKVVILFIGY